jgi:acyl carrier protein
MDRRLAATEGETPMLDRDQIRQTLAEILGNETGQKFDNLDDGNNLREELGLDSVDVVSTVSSVERRFRIRLSQQDLETLVTVGDLLNLMQAKLAEQPAASDTRHAA